MWWERSFILLMSPTHRNSELYVKNSSAVLTASGPPSMWLKGRNWKAGELHLHNKGWFTFSMVKTGFQTEPVSGAWEVFSHQGNIPCCDFGDSSKALNFFCKVGEGGSRKESGKVNLLGPYPPDISRPIRIAEVVWNKKSILLELATSGHLFKTPSWTAPHRYAHIGLKTTALVDRLGPSSMMPPRWSYYWLWLSNPFSMEKQKENTDFCRCKLCLTLSCFPVIFTSD